MTKSPSEKKKRINFGQLYVSVMLRWRWLLGVLGGFFWRSKVLGFCAGGDHLAVHQGLCDSHHFLHCFLVLKSVLEPEQQDRGNESSGDFNSDLSFYMLVFALDFQMQCFLLSNDHYYTHWKSSPSRSRLYVAISASSFIFVLSRAS